ncbi:LysM peptidoglycan-binding domain-containing protein [Sphingomonas psychrotolerans]|uniref:Peptidoglycan-binding protein LysM n=1 Tax=Sphingomonas psychrotolerans TaxID=1327635 RepID=A0A2K8MKT1_9SPHN|nr:DNA/RNA non-specific endonuclease [Sphingomonas psychrotolerans]ATY33614.1 peptidoglycan-binding protein LysM [Sphingomonas psychrotolerans]
MQHPEERSHHATAFEIYLRTGRRPVRDAIERKFNPWHDPDDGRFTFKDQGRYFPDGKSSARSPRAGARRTASPQNAGDAFARETDAARAQRENDPQNPRNHAIYVVRNGDSLTRIAATRKGLTIKDLAWLNRIPSDQRLRVGQRLKLPHQRYLDEGREAKNKFLALAYYMRTHGGRLPPNPANPPSLQSQILDSNWRRESRNGYDYQIDVISRTRRASGLLTFAERPRRSRANQANVPDRAEKDDGGHYVAARFNGPTDSFNHFAQSANFNRGGYRVLEDLWAAELRAGKKVFVDIVPHYEGASKRPDAVAVTWYVNGRRQFKNFPNKATDKKNGKR